MFNKLDKMDNWIVKFLVFLTIMGNVLMVDWVEAEDKTQVEGRSLIKEVSFYEPGRRLLNVKKTESPPIIDGSLNDVCWKKAGEATDFQLLDGIGIPTQKTQAFVAFDRENLYVAFLCFEENISNLVANVKEYGGKVWEDDCVEVFINANHDRKTFYHIVANSTGVLWVGTEMGLLQSDVKAGASVGSDRWQCELAIPIKELGVKSLEENNFWGFNLNRERYATSREYSGWTLTYGGFERPEQFGNLLLDIDRGEIPSQFMLNMKMAKTVYFLDDKECHLKLILTVQRVESLVVKLELTDVDRKEVISSGKVDKIEKREMDLKLDISYLSLGKYTITAMLEDTSGKRITSSYVTFERTKGPFDP